ncbi:MAG: formate dehydrogenase accessory sulfurtransferase FdhD [Burkholderiaceae bacterium]
MKELRHPPAGTAQDVPVRSLRADGAHAGRDLVAVEVPVALEFNGVSHAVMMATPADLEDFALGFSLTEGILEGAAQLHDMEAEEGPQGWTLRLEIASSRFARLKEMRRNLTGRTGCGLCGTESLSHAVRRPEAVPSPHQPFEAAAVARAMANMRGHQPLGSATGSTHAAIWCAADGTVRLGREDVGRHNALDKLIGAMARAGEDPRAGFIAVSSRASYEMVQKTGAARVSLLAAVSGVTALAVDVAAGAGMTLAGFARESGLSVYCGTLAGEGAR